jgi:hypothetical protein
MVTTLYAVAIKNEMIWQDDLPRELTTVEVSIIESTNPEVQKKITENHYVGYSEDYDQIPEIGDLINHAMFRLWANIDGISIGGKELS